MHDLKGHKDSVNSIVETKLEGFTSVLASAGSDKTVRLWDVLNGLLIKSYLKHTRSVNNLINLPWKSESPILVTSSLEKNVKIWR